MRILDTFIHELVPVRFQPIALELRLAVAHHSKTGMSRGNDNESAEDAGLRKLLGEMRPELSRFMLSRQCDPAEVEDLLQDLYVKLASTPRLASSQKLLPASTSAVTLKVLLKGCNRFGFWMPAPCTSA